MDKLLRWKRDDMITASFKNPRRKKLIYSLYVKESDVPKEIVYKKKKYILYGIH